MIKATPPAAKVMRAGQYSRGKCIMMKSLLLDETARKFAARRKAESRS